MTYPYKPPEYVNAADEDECSRRADSEAFAAVRGMSDWPATVFGPIGAIVQLGRAKSKLNSAYEQSMRSCLRGRGYDIPN
jgi:hypothetical protein